MLVQGRGVEDFVKFELEPTVFGEAKLGYEEVHSPEMFEPHFGVDESGKGDFFGPLVVAGVYVERLSARKLLDAGGFPKAAIAASNELDEHLITSLKDQGAKIDLWGVGTKLITAYDQPALGGVYKLSAMRPHGGQWQYRIKVSEQAIKTSNPGMLQVRRFDDADMIFDELAGAPSRTIVDPLDLTRRRVIADGVKYRDLLVPILRRGKRVYELPAIEEIRARRAAELERFHPGVKRFVNPHRYPVGLEKALFDLKTRLILEARGAPV